MCSPTSRSPGVDHNGQRAGQIGMPDAVFAVFAAGVGLVAVAVAEAGVDAQPHRMAGCRSADLAQHVDRTGVDGYAFGHHPGQRRSVDHVGREDDAGCARSACGVAGGQGPLDLTQGYGIDHHAFGTHQLQQVCIGIGLLRIADGVETTQLGDARADGGGVVDPQRCAVGACQSAQQGRIERVHLTDDAATKPCRQMAYRCTSIQS
jgi:hypothetical protein